jgi:hypothetical protein
MQVAAVPRSQKDKMFLFSLASTNVTVVPALHSRPGWTLTSSLLWSNKSLPATNLPPPCPFHSRLSPARVPVGTSQAVSLTSISLLNLGILPKADRSWRQAHFLHFLFARDHSATLTNQTAQQVGGQTFLSAFPLTYLDNDLSSAHRVSTRSIQRTFLQTPYDYDRVLRPTCALSSASSSSG